MRLRFVFVPRWWPLAICVAFLATSLRISAETLKAVDGQAIEADIRGLYGNLLLIKLKKNSALINVNELDDASLIKVAGFLESVPTAPVSWNTSTSRIAKATKKKLQILQNGKFVDFDPGSRPEPEFYLVYYGAYWCGPCRRFSPRLVESYQRLKAADPTRFEVLFLSDDTDAGEQLKYAREVNMPWPVVKFSSAQGIDVFEQWRASGIPSLVVLNRDGDLLYHSYRGNEYLGADDPLEKFTALLSALHGAAPVRPENHRLAVAQHVRSAGAGDRPPSPYMVSINPNRQRGLGVQRLVATLTLDPTGHVLGAEFSPQLGAAAEEMMQREAEHWLFLPAIKQGTAVKAVIELPMELKKS